ncbi:hypothetical protein Tco_0614508 [Tanacetum coccineum]
MEFHGVNGADGKTGNRPLKSILKKYVYRPPNVLDAAMMSMMIPIRNEKASVHVVAKDNIAVSGNNNTHFNKDEGAADSVQHIDTHIVGVNDPVNVQPDVETPSPFAIRLMESDANSGSCEVDVSAVESSDCVLPKAAANKIKRRYENSLVGFFVGMEQVLENGPWMIRKSPIILNKWSSSVISFTRALIEISSDSTLKDEVIMAILEEEGDGHIKEVIRVVYMEATALCRMYVAANKPSNTENNDEGFVEVKSQKNKGKDASRSIGGGTTKERNNKVSSLTRAISDWTTSNTFDALNMVEEDVQDPSVQNCSKLDGEKCQEEDSLWSIWEIRKNIVNSEMALGLGRIGEDNASKAAEFSRVVFWLCYVAF